MTNLVRSLGALCLGLVVCVTTASAQTWDDEFSGPFPSWANAKTTYGAVGDGLADADRRKLLKLQARLSMAQGGGDADTAAILEEVVQIDPLDGEALMLLGQHWNRQQQPDKAILY